MPGRRTVELPCEVVSGPSQGAVQLAARAERQVAAAAARHQPQRQQTQQ